jgi:hypothetical protein
MVGHVTGLDQVRDGGIGFRQFRGGAGAREAGPCAQVCVAIAVTMARAQRTISLRGAKRAAREVYVGRTQKNRALDVMAGRLYSLGGTDSAGTGEAGERSLGAARAGCSGWLSV